MANGNLMYQQSISAEFKAIQNRVRYFINDAHWGEDGRYKEIILQDFLKSIMPSNVGVGTGFVKNKDGDLTSQIDIIIYKNDYPRLFQQGDFVVLLPESVLGIIEVKSTARAKNMADAIQKASHNSDVISNPSLFNGIFAYDKKCYTKDSHPEKLKNMLIQSCGKVNHIVFGDNLFMRYWEDGNPDRDDKMPTYSFYKMYDLAYGYFISNLLESTYIQVNPNVAMLKHYIEFLYPIEEGKETRRLDYLNIDLGDCNEQD